MNLQTAIDTITQLLETDKEPITGVTRMSEYEFYATQQIGDTVVNWYIEFNEAGNITTLK